jgi:serine/threonine-protein kinase
MDPERWKRIQSLFHTAADLPDAERSAFLHAECADDRELLSQVLAMIEEDARSSGLLERAVADGATEMLSENDRLPMTELGPYRIKKWLGQGGMGVVYLAERSDIGGLTAIKVLRDAWQTPDRRERFVAEQRILAQLSHPAIAKIYDADSLPEGTSWFVMEYVEGVPITEYCRTHRTSIDGRLALFRGVCEAVQYAHGQAVIHRDLKPSNILVKEDGTVKLLDFGIAKQLDVTDAAKDQTLTGLGLMTPAYAAPEQIRGERVDIRTDVYALGVVLYELLTGQPAFDLSSCTPVEAVSILLDKEPERPSALVTRLGDAEAKGLAASKTAWSDLDVMCATTMHKDATRRYQTVDALIQDVDRYFANQPLTARPDTVGYRLGKLIRRNRTKFVTATLALAATVALVVFYTVRLTSARNAALAEAARTRRIQSFTMSLFEGGTPDAGPAGDLKVVGLVDQGVRQARELDADPEAQAELYATLGAISEKLGRIDQADTLLQSALEQRRKLFKGDNPAIAESLIALGLLRSEQAQHDEAERFVRDGLEMARRVHPSDPATVARDMTALGEVLENRDEYQRAIEVLEQAVALQSAPSVPPADLVATLTELANCHFYLSHYDVSEPLYRRVLELDRRIFGDHHPHVAHDLLNLGAVALRLGRYPEAEAFNRDALAIFQAWYGNDHPETASAWTILGRVLVAQERFDEADGMLRHALAIQERAYGPVHPRVASALNELAAVAMQRGKMDDAESICLRMRDIYRKVYGDQDPHVALAMAGVADVYLQSKQFARAEPVLREVVTRYTRAQPEDPLNAGIAHLKLGHALLGQRRFAEARDESLAGYELVSALSASRKQLRPTERRSRRRSFRESSMLP